MGLNKIIERIQEKCTEQSVIIIGIDGCGGAGKSTLANKIKSNFSTVTIVHMDDFIYHLQRLKMKILRINQLVQILTGNAF